MGLYTRQQLTLLLLLVGAAGLGLAVVHWRAAHPEVVERLEQVERTLAPGEEPTGPRVAEPVPGRSPDGERVTRGPRPPKRRAVPADEPRAPLDLNRATLDELARLPGVGPVLARRILDTRDALQRFAAVDDLVRVRGLGRAKLERLRPFVSALE